MNKTKFYATALAVMLSAGLFCIVACQKEEEPIVATGGATVEDNEVYTTELPGTEWRMYDTMEWYHDGIKDKYPFAADLRFLNDSIAKQYAVDYLNNSTEGTEGFTYSYYFDGSEGELTIIKAPKGGSSSIGFIFTMKYDGKQDALLLQGSEKYPPLVYTRKK